MFSRYLPGGKARSPEAPLFEQALVLVRHDVGLHLRHEVHGHHDDDEERGAAEVERHVPPQDQELGQQADQGHVNGSCKGQSQEDLLEIFRRLLAGPDAGNEGARLLQIVRRLLRIVLQRRIEKAEENDRACIEHDVHGLAAFSLMIRDLASTLTPGQPVYVMLYASAIVFFCFFYTALQYNPKETADNLKKSGAFVPGIRPGEQTAKYLEKILLRLTLAGAIYVTLVCLLPEFLILRWNVPFYFGGTSLLIIVVVTMDFMAQVQAYIMTHQYESLLKKGGFRGGGFPTTR